MPHVPRQQVVKHLCCLLVQVCSWWSCVTFLHQCIHTVFLIPQVIFALPPVGETDLAMRIYNSDGSEPEMCGNGIRCLARFVADVDGAAARKYRIHTLAGLCPMNLKQLHCSSTPLLRTVHQRLQL